MIPAAELVIALSLEDQRYLVEALPSPSSPSTALMRAVRSHAALI